MLIRRYKALTILLVAGCLLTGCNSMSGEVPVVPVVLSKQALIAPAANGAVTPSSTKLESSALLLIKNHNMSAAEVLLKKEIQRHPSSISARTNLALIYASDQRNEEAEVILSDIVHAHPDACPAQVKLGQLHREAFRFDHAEAAYQTCLTHDPKYAPALRNLGILHELYRGAFARALTFYERYQGAIEEPDQQVERWIVDLSRRLASHNQIAEARP